MRGESVGGVVTGKVTFPLDDAATARYDSRLPENMGGSQQYPTLFDNRRKRNWCGSADPLT
jgi:hypothetical protein